MKSLIGSVIGGLGFTMFLLQVIPVYLLCISSWCGMGLEPVQRGFWELDFLLYGNALSTAPLYGDWTGIIAALSFCTFLLGLTIARSDQMGGFVQSAKSTMIGVLPVALLLFEIGSVITDRGDAFNHVVNILEGTPLSWLLTNFNLLIASAVMVVGPRALRKAKE